jgi:hypothetical protein
LRTDLRLHSTCAVLAILLGACEAPPLGDALQELRAERAAPVDPFSTDVLARGARELEARLGAPLRLLRIEASQHRVVFSVQDPRQPAHVDAYELRRGVLLAPQPVLLRDDTDLERQLFALSEVPLERVPELARAAVSAIALPEAELRSLTVHRKFSSSSMPPEMRQAMDAARERAGLTVEREEPPIPDGGIAVELSVDSPRRMGYVLADAGFAVVRTNVY